MNFDWVIYRELNPDLKAAGLVTQRDVENHYRVHCTRDKRLYNIYQAYPDFNPSAYHKLYPDLSKMSKLELERHWVLFGRNEKRTYKLDPQQDDKCITFIIPTIGRSTLIQTIRSLIRQTNNNWKCIIVCDGIDLSDELKNMISNDVRISSIKINKTGFINDGINNHGKAGEVRNYGLSHVKTGWVGFVDDDDELSPLYLENFTNHISEYSNINCIIFRMMYDTGCIFPEKDSTNFVKSRVGISFCYSTELVNRGIKFTTCDVEDFMVLNNIRQNGYKILLSNKICYFVRPSVNIDLDYVNALKSRENDILKSIIN
jgi:glycosyltransferase involved in cell wall biosynthesis